MSESGVSTVSYSGKSRVNHGKKLATAVTFDGEEFIAPETHDIIKSLFDPYIKKSILTKVILLLLFLSTTIFWLVRDNKLRIQIYIGMYLFWRLSYNVGIGYLLRKQSNEFMLLDYAKENQIFDSKSKSLLARLAQFEIRSQMDSLYRILIYPPELNTWLLFRKLVDLILMQDFTTFTCLVICCAVDDGYQFVRTDLQSAWLVSARFFVGALLILFNLWVKVNAHNTIKDYAWYWGDFFFRQINNEELIFDGVFEMVPHPMYSVGYVGYYGLALISKSYVVLTVSIFGHFLQMIFLHYIEDPHIDKIYGAPSDSLENKLLKFKDLKNFDNVKPLVGLWNFNLFRSSDLLNLILCVSYGIIIPYLCSMIDDNYFRSSKIRPNGLLFILSVIIKLFEIISIDVLLILQSYYKTFTKWYLSNDISLEQSLNNWSVIYNSIINMTYSSFFGFNAFNLIKGVSKENLFINDWFELRVFLGLLLVFTQVWINTSIIDLIGYFGWFYGDFFIPKQSQRAPLTKAGIYRYLNNPEQLFAVCGIMGVTLIIPNWENLMGCLLWVISNFVRINFIEKPHMIQIYGENEVLEDSGVTRTFKKHLIPVSLQRRLSSLSRGTGDHEKKPHFITGASDTIETFLKEFKNRKDSFTRQNVLDLSENLFLNMSEYSIKVKDLNTNDSNSFAYTYIGDPIEVEWSVPSSHSQKDWIALYRISRASYSRYKTLSSSSGRWTWVTDEEGSFSFRGEKSSTEPGLYEIRYHLNGKHDVACISEPFEIKAPEFVIPQTKDRSEALAMTIKSLIFDKVISEIESVDVPIEDSVNKTGNVIEAYEKLAYLITVSCGIHISAKVFINSKEKLTLRGLSEKLIEMKSTLEVLSGLELQSQKRKGE